MSNSDKSLQFELWQECNSFCKFCYLGGATKHTPTELKINSLKNALATISDDAIMQDYDVLSYLGGEFFQGQLNDPTVYALFMELMQKTADHLLTGKIKSVWIYATMTLGNQKDLYDTLEMFKNHPGFWLLTSYDTLGRFHSEKMHSTWHSNMLKVHEMYPEYKFNTTMILTGDLIDKYLNDEISFNAFMETYNTQLFFKQGGTVGDITPENKKLANESLPNFFPTREKFIEFLTKFVYDCPHLYDKLFNIKYRADSLYRNFNDASRQMELNIRFKDSNVETSVEAESYLNTCGHLMNYAAYVDSNECCVCDKLSIQDFM